MKSLMEQMNELEAQEVLNLSDAEIAERFNQLDLLLKDFEVEKEFVKQEIVRRMQEEKKLDSAVWGNYSVTIRPRPSYSKVPIEIAESLGAIKKSIDGIKLGKLIKAGAIIEGYSQTLYPIIKSLESKE